MSLANLYSRRAEGLALMLSEALEEIRGFFYLLEVFRRGARVVVEQVGHIAVEAGDPAEPLAQVHRIRWLLLGRGLEVRDLRIPGRPLGLDNGDLLVLRPLGPLDLVAQVAEFLAGQSRLLGELGDLEERLVGELLAALAEHGLVGLGDGAVEVHAKPLGALLGPELGEHGLDYRGGEAERRGHGQTGT